ncbi:MAG: hypothetical protein V7629_08550 [Motiliproteus sp.]
MMIISTAPVFCAIIARLLLGERVNRRTAATIACTLVGISVIAVDSGGDNSVLGNLYALGCALFVAINFNGARPKAPRDLIPVLPSAEYVSLWLRCWEMLIRLRRAGYG